MSKESKRDILICLTLVLVLIVIPLIFNRGAEFGGSDDAGADAVSTVQGYEYEPWFTPVMELFLGDEIPGELESLLFCVQTGIGVGIIAFLMGKWSERYRLTSTKKGREECERLLAESQKESPSGSQATRLGH